VPKIKPTDAPVPFRDFLRREELGRRMAEQIANARGMAELARQMRKQAIDMRERNRKRPS
jgi:hypothetical protein